MEGESEMDGRCGRRSKKIRVGETKGSTMWKEMRMLREQEYEG